MQLEVMNLPAHHVGEVERACNFFAEKLMSKRLKDSISVKLEFKTALSNGWKGALLSSVEDPTEFTMLIPLVNLREVLTSLAHEFVHIKQYVKGELRDMECGVMFKNTYYDVDEDDEEDEEDYWLHQPWEIEARGLEIGLYTLYSNQFHNGKVPYISTRH